MGACRHGTYLRVFKFFTLEEKFHIYKQPRDILFINVYKHTNDDLFDDFPKISEHFPKISEDSSKVVCRQNNRFRTLSENFRRLPKISLEETMMFFTSENNIYFSRVKICLRAKAHLVFHWC